MDEFGRKSNGHSDFQLDFNRGNQYRNDLRSYSVNSSSQSQNQSNLDPQFPYEFDLKLKRTKTTSGSSSSLSKVWSFNDPEFKRKKRVATYRALTFEGKVKGSFRKSFNWLKDRFLYGWW